jgi:hypothetical protein
MAFTKKTVFVVGAGASLPYGYPLGTALVDMIVAKCKEREKHHDQVAKKLKDLIMLHDPLSIDSFLAQHCKGTELETLGKQLITECILECEDPKRFDKGHQIGKNDKGDKSDKANENWYRFLAHAMFEDRDDLVNEDIDLPFRIITFNYDVSLDYYLISRILGAELLTPEERGIIFGKLKDAIIHVYGSVRNVPWDDPEGTVFPLSKINNNVFTYKNSGTQRTEGTLTFKELDDIGYFVKKIYGIHLYNYTFTTGNQFNYNNDIDAGHFRNLINQAANNLKVIGETERDGETISEQLQPFYEFMKNEMERLVFLGFGFDETNVELLFPQDVRDLIPKKDMEHVFDEQMNTKIRYKKLRDEVEGLSNSKSIFCDEDKKLLIQGICYQEAQANKKVYDKKMHFQRIYGNKMRKNFQSLEIYYTNYGAKGLIDRRVESLFPECNRIVAAGDKGVYAALEGDFDLS